MAYFKKIESDRRFVVIDKDHIYFNCVVAIYDSSRSGFSMYCTEAAGNCAFSNAD